MTLNSFLQNSLPDIPYRALTATGYSASNMDILLGSLRRSKIISENYMSDFALLETDTNFLRKHPQNRNALNKLASKLGLTTQLATTIGAFLEISKINEFLPENLKRLCGDYIGMADSGILILNNISDGSFMRNLQSMLLKDILSVFNNSLFSVDDLYNSATAVIDAYEMLPSIKNLGIRSLLALPIQKIVGKEFSFIFESLATLDDLYSVFVSGQTLQNFLDQLSMLMYADDEPVGNNSHIQTTYSNSVIKISDPFGIDEVDSFQASINEIVAQNLSKNVDILLSTDEFAPYANYKATIISIISEKINEQSDVAFDSNIGLPPLQDSMNAINTEVYNQTIESFVELFDLVAKHIITDINVSYDGYSSNPIDFLINLRKNIEFRNSMDVSGGDAYNYEQLQRYFKSVIGSNSQEKINAIYSKLNG